MGTEKPPPFQLRQFQSGDAQAVWRLHDAVRAQALGCRAIHLDTTDEQIAAQRLYESAGSQETGRRQTDRFLFIDYSKTLTPKRGHRG